MSHEDKELLVAVTQLGTTLAAIKQDTFDQLVKMQAIYAVAVQQQQLLQKIVLRLPPPKPQLKTMRLIFAVAQ